MMQQNILIVSKQAKTYSEDEVIEFFNKASSLNEMKPIIEGAESRLYTTWATVDAVDKDKQKVPIEEAIKQIEILMKRDAPIQDTHTNKNVGKTLAYRILEHPVTKTTGILQLNKIYNDNILDDKVWTETVDGTRQGSSVGGFSTDKQVESDGNSVFENLKGFNWLETSNVVGGCNPYATNEAFSLVAKKDKMKEEVKKQEEEMSTETPEVSVEDRVSNLEEGLGAVMAKLDELIQATAGTPEVEKEEEESNPAVPEEKEVEKEAEAEPEKEEKKEDDVEKSLNEIKSELAEVKKQLEKNKVVDVVKTEMPVTKDKAEKETFTMTDVLKGKATFKQLTGEEN